MISPLPLAFILVVPCIDAGQDELRSLTPIEVLAKLDFDRPGLEAAKAAVERGDHDAAFRAMLEYYRARFPRPPADPNSSTRQFPVADQIARHVFQWGPYEPADYGPDVNWEWDPRGDIEWVAAVYRFYWARPLADAFAATRDQKYSKAFVELTADWIKKHPLESRHRTHPVYTRWRGFAWLDIQTGIRAESLCRVFPALVHGESFTPEFLGMLLASLYDHQAKTEQLPMKAVHNKAVFEQRGFIHVAITFPEFKDTQRWLELGIGRTRENFLAQVTADGVQREWSWGYNLAVLRDAVEIMQWMDSRGVPVADDYRERVRKMYDYIFAMATPELAGPMFGDAARPPSRSPHRTQWPLYPTLAAATQLLGDPKYEALAKLERDRLPGQKSFAFPDAGMYVMRNDWGPDQIYFALHCSPPAISSHDQPDNNTFELCAFGRWLMPDSGYYTYGHDSEGRAWHRRTRVHQTLTLDGKDSRVAGKHLLWSTSPQLDALTVENASYDRLTHRRSVWFVDKSFFVLLDEAIGLVEGDLALHFQLAPGEVQIDIDRKRATTAFNDVNVLIGCDAAAPVSMHTEDGWHAWDYGHREPRQAFSYRHAKAAPAAFLTVVYPYRGVRPPHVAVNLPAEFHVGSDRIELCISAGERTWRIGRDLNAQQAWCRDTTPSRGESRTSARLSSN